MIENLKITRRKMLRLLEMRPIHKVIRLLKQNNYLLMDNVLEVFGYKGEYHTLDYVKYVNQLDIWEIQPECEIHLKNNLPRANVKITNSYLEIKQTDKIFDTIIIDNHQGTFADKCEHFEIINDCFKKLSQKAVLIVNIIPDMSRNKYKIPYDEKLKYINKRKEFYSHESGISITKVEFQKFYTKLALNNGFTTNHIFIVKRNYLMAYLVLCLEKNER